MTNPIQAPSHQEEEYNPNLPINLAATIHRLIHEYNEANEQGKAATLDTLTGWLVHEKGHRAYLKNRAKEQN